MTAPEEPRLVVVFQSWLVIGKKKKQSEGGDIESSYSDRGMWS